MKLKFWERPQHYWGPPEEADVLVCVSFDAEHVELSELDVCRDCGAQIWVSPSGRVMQREKSLKIICLDCMPDPNREEVAIAAPTAEQAREIVNYLRSRERGV